MRSKFHDEDELPAEENGALRIPVINVEDEQRDQSHRDAERAPRDSMREPVTENVESDWSRL